MHPGRRCEFMDARFYESGPSMEGICAERQAMIAVTAVEPPPSASPDKCFELRTGRNTIPLGGPVRWGVPPAGLLSGQKPPVNFDTRRSSSTAGEQERMQYVPQQLETPSTRARGSRELAGMADASHPADRLMGFDTSSAPPRGPLSIRGHGAPGQAPNGSRATASLPYRPLTYASSLPMNDHACAQSSGLPLPTISPSMAEPGFHGEIRAIGMAVPGLHPLSAIHPQDGFLSMTKGAMKQASKLSPEQTSDIGAQPMAIWSDFCQHVYNVVRGAQDRSRIHNNGLDAEAVDARIRQALSTVKPLVVRQQSQHCAESTTFSQVKIEAAPAAQDQEPQPNRRKRNLWQQRWDVQS